MEPSKHADSAEPETVVGAHMCSDGSHNGAQKAAAKRERDEDLPGEVGDDAKKPREDVGAASDSTGFGISQSNPWAAAASSGAFGRGFIAPSLSSALPGCGWAAQAWSAPAVGAMETSASSFGSSPGILSTGWGAAAWGAPAAAAAAGPQATESSSEGVAKASFASRSEADNEVEAGDEGEDGDLDAEAHNRALLAAGVSSSASASGFSTLPVGTPLPTGEEHEVSILQLRGKLFVMEKEKELVPEFADSHHGVPSIAGSPITAPGPGGAGASGPRLGAGGLGDRMSSSSTPSVISAPVPTSCRWRECGTGPLRLNVRRDVAETFLAQHLPQGYVSLKQEHERNKMKRAQTLEEGAAAAFSSGSSNQQESPVVDGLPPSLPGPACRLVMRQEISSGSSHGGRVLLNAVLHPDFPAHVHPSSDRAVQFTAPQPVDAASSGSSAGAAVLSVYLIRLQSGAQANELVDAVTDVKKLGQEAKQSSSGKM